MGIATQYVQAMSVGNLAEVLLIGTFAIMAIGKVALHLIKRYL